MASQPVLAAPPPVGRFLELDLRFGADCTMGLHRLRSALPPTGVVGVGAPLVSSLDASIPGLRAFPAVTGPACTFPSTQAALWAFVGGATASAVHDAARAVLAALGDDFLLRAEIASFTYRDGRDLSGYVDGTANPVDEQAVAAAIVSGRGPGLDGSTFVAVQRWVHDLKRFDARPQAERDLVIGRRLSDNEELPDAPPTAHVKRAEQESFSPPAFLVRRSMPWGSATEHGLYFVAYGESLDRFERVLRRMAGQDDGVTDGLLTFSRAVSGGYYWCPPLREGKLDWSALGLRPL